MRVLIGHHPCQHLILSVFFYIGRSNRCVVVSSCGFNLCLLNGSDVECLFLCLFAIRIMPLAKCSGPLHFFKMDGLFSLYFSVYVWFCFGFFTSSISNISCSY